MSLTLKYWKSRKGEERIFINGVTETGNVWFAELDGGVTIKWDREAGRINEDQVARQVIDQYGIDLQTWSGLASLAKNTTRQFTKKPIKLADAARTWDAYQDSALAVTWSASPLPGKIDLVLGPDIHSKALEFLNKVHEITISQKPDFGWDMGIPDKVGITLQSVDHLENFDPDLTEWRELTDSGMIIAVIVFGDFHNRAVTAPDPYARLVARLAGVGRVSILPAVVPSHAAHIGLLLVKNALFGAATTPFKGYRRDNETLKKRVLMSIPGVSGVSADKLIATYGSIAGIAYASDKDLLALLDNDMSVLKSLRSVL